MNGPGENPGAAADLCLPQVGPRNVEVATVAGTADLGFAILGVDTAHANRHAGRRQHQLIADPDGTGEDSAGHDETAAGNGEAAVDGKPEVADRESVG